MRAVVYRGPEDIRLEQVAEPALVDADDAIVRVTTTSICGSDLHILHGLLPRMEPGRIIGHEYTGEVHEVGVSVKRIKPGDRVVGAAAVWCGRCRACKRGLFSACENGATFGHGPLLGDLAGAQADYVRVPLADNALRLVPSGLSDDQVIFAGDILPTAYSALAGLSPGVRGVREGDNVVVFGLGPVGLCAVASAKLFKPATVIAVDIQADRLEVAKGLGADHVLDGSAEEDLRGAIKRLTDGWGADLVVEAVGKRESLADSVAVSAPGGVVSVLGAFQEPTVVNAPRMQAKNVTVVMGMGDLGRMDELLTSIETGDLDLTSMVTHKMDFGDVMEAYEVFDRKKDGAIKILLST